MYYFFCLCENNAPVTSFSEKKKVLPKDFDQWTKEIAEFVQDLRRGTITPERTADPRIGGWIPLAEEHFWEFKQLKGRPF
ncbi:hypothetical protein HQ520_07050 [bacterium]|nr:hypothetical protein [bacterium]